MRNDGNIFTSLLSYLPAEHSSGCMTEEELDDDDEDDDDAVVCCSSTEEEELAAETARRRPISCSTDCKFGVVRSCNTRISRNK